MSSVLSKQWRGWGTIQSWGCEEGAEGLKCRHVVAMTLETHKKANVRQDKSKQQQLQWENIT